MMGLCAMLQNYFCYKYIYDNEKLHMFHCKIWLQSWNTSFFKNKMTETIKLIFTMWITKNWSIVIHMNSMKTCPSVTFYFMKISFSDSNRFTALIIFGKIHFLLISENEFFMK